MSFIWTCPHTRRTMTSNRAPLDEEGVVYAEVADSVTANTHYLATTGEVLPVPTKPVSDEMWEFDPMEGRWFSLMNDVQRANNLTVVRDRAIRHVNAKCGEVRAQFVTPITGQELTYMTKEAEARAYLADPEPNPADYPYLTAEAGITAATAEQVAQIYLNLGARWRAVGAALETHRLGFIARLEGALDVLHVHELRGEFNAAHTALLESL